MNILYASNACSKKEFTKIYNICKIKPLQSIQKFNELLLSGMVEEEDVKLNVITSAPINFKMCKKIFWKNKKEIHNNITYNYCFMINLPIIKFISLFFSSVRIIRVWCRKVKNTDSIIIYDAYCPVIANMAAIIGNKYGIKIYGLYTDVPKFMNSSLERVKIIKRLFKNIFSLMDKRSNKIAKGYILLTEQMNDVVNQSKKPYIVVEGLVNSKSNFENNIKNKYEKFTVLYAGGLYKKYGIENLIKAINKIENNEIMLVLYGEGELVEQLKNQYKDNKKIYYGGNLPNEQIVKEEIKSTILINPRFSNEEYTKYSFPSKNMEYMLSGTPLLTTKLPGMPKEYYEYLFFIEEETIEGIKTSIEKLMNKSRKELYEKGVEAKEFVINNKNNLIQAKRIIEFFISIK